MNINNILKCLCIYDKRNPESYIMGEEELEDDKKDCFCDNCFNGKSELAKELIKYINKGAKQESTGVTKQQKLLIAHGVKW